MSSSGRRRTTDRHYSAEDQALDQISKEAEERIQARRQVRAEAREIRLREIEKQQKEEEERQKPGTDSSKTLSSYSGSRRGSDDSTDTDVSSRDGKESKDLLRDLKHSLREMEEKFRQAMVTNAQLENIKTSQIFQLELLKEQLEEKEEGMIEVQREYKDKCREFDFLKRDFNTMKLETEQYKHQLDVRDRLLKDSGLVIIASEEGEFSLTKCADLTDIPEGPSGTSLISEAAADLLKKAGEGTLGNIVTHEDTAPHNTIQHNENSVDDLSEKPFFNSTDKVELLSDKTDQQIDDAEIVPDVPSMDTAPYADISGTVESVSSTGSQVSKAMSGEVEAIDSKSLGLDTDIRHVDGQEKNAENVEQANKIEVLTESPCINIERKEAEIIDVEKDEKESCVPGGYEDDEEDVFYESKSEVVDNFGERASETEDQPEQLQIPKVRNVEKNVHVSESCISMESDVTYHSESETCDSIDPCINFTLESQEVAVGITLESDVHVDGTEAVAGIVKDISDEFEDNGEKDLVKNSDKVAREMSIEENRESFVSCSDFNLDEMINVKDNVVGIDSGFGEIENVDSKFSKEEEIVNVAQSLLASDETVDNARPDSVFLSGTDDDGSSELRMKLFAEQYVSGIVSKAVDQLTEESGNDYVSTRSSDSVDIRIPRRQYSKEIVDEVTPIFRQSLSRGSVSLLSPITQVDTSTDPLKFFEFKVDTDADVVLTSLEEGSVPSVVETPFSPVSGFGVCFMGDCTQDMSDTDSESDNLGGGSSQTELLGNTGLNLQVLPMNVSLEKDANTVKQADTENIAEENKEQNEGTDVVQERKESADSCGKEDEDTDTNRFQLDTNVMVTDLDSPELDDLLEKTFNSDSNTTEDEVNKQAVVPGLTDACEPSGKITETDGTVTADRDNNNIDEGAAGGSLPKLEAELGKEAETHDDKADKRKSQESRTSVTSESRACEEDVNEDGRKGKESKKKKASKRGSKDEHRKPSKDDGRKGSKDDSKKQSKEECLVS